MECSVLYDSTIQNFRERKFPRNSLQQILADIILKKAENFQSS